MSREWVAGDVALVSLRDDADGRGDGNGEAVAIRDNVGSWACGAAIGRQVKDRDVITARPLVVIDPEDREQVDRFCKALVEAMYIAGDKASAANGVHPGTAMAALRSLVEPPKPEEPIGLGAVVEVQSTRPGLTGMTRRLVRTHATHEPWWGDNQKRDWDEISGPIRILSPGVTP